MAVQVGSMFASLTVDTQQFIRGMGQADKFTGTTMESIRRKGDGAARSLDGLARVFGGAGLASGTRALQEMNRSAGALPVSFRAATTALAGLGGVFGGAALTKTLDTFTGLQNQLRSLGDGFGSTGAQFEALLGVASRSRTDIDAVVTLFTRLAKAQPGASFEKTARSVETVTKALQLGGATAEEAASAAIQFSQAIQSGRLGGDELRAVLESPLGNALAKGLGITVGKMRELSVQGKLTSDVVLGALEKIGPEIDAKFSKSVITIGQSFTLLQNQIVATVGKLDESFGASRIITSGISAVADNLDLVTKAAAAAALAIGSISVGKIGGGGVAAIGASFRSLGADAQAGVSAATQQIGVLEDALKRAQAEQAKLNSFQGPFKPAGAEKFNQAIALNNRRIAEITSLLPQASVQLGKAQKAATGFGLALTGLRSAGGSLVAFLGGPWGVAFAAAAAGVGLLAAKQAEAAQTAREYEEIAADALNKKAKTDSAAGDLAAQKKQAAGLEDLQKQVNTVRATLRKTLDPLVAIGEKIDDLRRRQLEFVVSPNAPRIVDFLREETEKLLNGGSIEQINADLDRFQKQIGRPTSVKDTLFYELHAQIARAAEQLKVLSIKQEEFNQQAKEGLKLSAVASPEAATDTASSLIANDRGAKAAAASALFALKVDSIKSKEKQIADTIAKAVTDSGFKINAALQQYINGLARTKALTDEVASTQLKTFDIKQNPNVRYPPGKGPNAGLEQGNEAAKLQQLFNAQKQIQDLRDKINAEKQTIGNSGGMLKDLFGDRADSAEVKNALTGVEGNIKKVFDEFSTGKIDAVQAFNAIQNIRQQLVDLGALPGPLDAFMEQIQSAITGVPNLKAQIIDLTVQMRALAAAANSVILPGGAKSVTPPNGPLTSLPLPKFATGGAFKVGGNGGTDSQLVQFMASPTETVAVFTPSQVKALSPTNDNALGGGTTVNAYVNIYAQDAASFKNSRRQTQMDIADAVQAAVNRTR